MLLIAGASPLIVFAILDRLHLLEQIFDEIAIPETVYKEISKKGKPYWKELQDWAGGKAKAASSRHEVEAFALSMGRGEAEAFTLYYELSADIVLLDDLKARKIAEQRKVSYIGSLGVLLKAKRKGLIPELKPLIEQLQQNSIWISDPIRNAILEGAGETP